MSPFVEHFMHYYVDPQFEDTTETSPKDEAYGPALPRIDQILRLEIRTQYDGRVLGHQRGWVYLLAESTDGRSYLVSSRFFDPDSDDESVLQNAHEAEAALQELGTEVASRWNDRLA